MLSRIAPLFALSTLTLGCQGHTQRISPSAMPSVQGLSVDRGAPEIAASAGLATIYGSSEGRGGISGTIRMADGVDAIAGGQGSIDQDQRVHGAGHLGVRTTRPVGAVVQVSGAAGIGAAVRADDASAKHELGSFWAHGPPASASGGGVEASFVSPPQRSGFTPMQRFMFGVSLHQRLGTAPEPAPTVLTDALLAAPPQRKPEPKTNSRGPHPTPQRRERPAPLALDADIEGSAEALYLHFLLRDGLRGADGIPAERAALERTLRGAVRAEALASRIPAGVVGGSLGAYLSELRLVDDRVVPTPALSQTQSVYQRHGWSMRDVSFRHDLAAMVQASKSCPSCLRRVGPEARHPGDMATKLAKMGVFEK